MSDEVDAIMKQTFGTNDRFDFEETLTRCWCVVDDLKELDEMIFEDIIRFDKDNISNRILGIANTYDTKFEKLWHLFETVFMPMVRENKMLNEECAAMREQMGFAADGQGFGIEAIKPRKKK